MKMQRFHCQRQNPSADRSCQTSAPFAAAGSNLLRSTLADGMLLLAGALWLVLVPFKVLAMMPTGSPGGPFALENLDAWTERSFKGNTEYLLQEDQGVPVLRAQTRGQASVLYREQQIDLSRTPILEWSWKIEHTFSDINERTRDGDDFPARIYVVARTGFLPWETVAINYVWASGQPLEASWSNPFSDRARMVVVESGEECAGIWVRERRNVAEDFRQYFGIDVEALSGYAVMVDGDNSNREALTWFGEIRFSAN